MKPSDEKHMPWVSLLLSIASVLVGIVAVWMTHADANRRKQDAALLHDRLVRQHTQGKRGQVLLVELSQGKERIRQGLEGVPLRLRDLQEGMDATGRSAGRVAYLLPVVGYRLPVWQMDWDALPDQFVHVDPLSGQSQAFVLVPGDREQGVFPLYVATTETTWDHFEPWAHGVDLDFKDLMEMRRKQLRPWFGWHWRLDHHMGMGQKPAIAMSLLSAKRFAQHQAALSGLSIRLPTEAEWEHVYETTQGPLDEVPENLDVVAVHDGNCDLETEAVGSRQANAFGIHDLLGNVSEWVVASGEPLGAVRGGNFATQPKAATGLQRDVANQETWNLSWPDISKSKWWFVDHIDHGFRLVCDPSPALLKHVAEQAAEPTQAGAKDMP